MTPPTGRERGTNAPGARRDPRDVLSPDVVERLLDVMARLVVNAARVRAERAVLEARDPRVRAAAQKSRGRG